MFPNPDPTRHADPLDWAEHPPMSACVTPGAHGSVTITVSGEIDVHDARDLRDVAVTAMTSYRGPVTLDLTGVTFCDCAGLGALVQIRRQALRAGRRLLIRAGRQVDHLIRLTGTGPYLHGLGPIQPVTIPSRQTARVPTDDAGSSPD
ncbi:STAS domain-containing protein [Streptomyces sp. NPDC048269]|uniref:STAS domain-containing protein n=1 Tax=Streptomyces sp. NPDC048269 TaxID=3155753 RepID=UPI0034397058